MTGRRAFLNAQVIDLLKKLLKKEDPEIEKDLRSISFSKVRVNRAAIDADHQHRSLTCSTALAKFTC